MDAARILIRSAIREDAAALAQLAGQLAHSFPFSREAFDASLDALIDDDHAHLLVAVHGHEVRGYLLGFDHLTFFANGRVAWVEEMLVDSDHRRLGIGRRLTDEFAQRAESRDCGMIALATRRATSFYQALGFEESAAYLRKLLPKLHKD